MTETLLLGDCLEQMRTLPDNSVDSVVTDPPYGLSEEPDIAEVLTHWLSGEPYEHGRPGFMGADWDSLVPGPGHSSSAFYPGDTGTATRFFYCAKASTAEREAGLEPLQKKDVGHSAYGEFKGTPEHASNNGKPRANDHKTVKPLQLMRYLVRLIKTPTGGVVLDPFMGSGTTGCACVLEDCDFIGIEIEESSFKIAELRIDYWKRNGDNDRLNLIPVTDEDGNTRVIELEQPELF